MDWEFGVGRGKLFHLEWISNDVLLYSTGNDIQSLGINHDRKDYEKKKCMYVYNEATFLSNRNQHNIVNQLYFNTNKQRKKGAGCKRYKKEAIDLGGDW